MRITGRMPAWHANYEHPLLSVIDMPVLRLLIVDFYRCGCASMVAWYMLSSCVRLSVCLSISLSVTSQYCTEMAKRRITQTMPYNSPSTLVF